MICTLASDLVRACANGPSPRTCRLITYWLVAVIPDPRAARSIRFARTVDGYHPSTIGPRAQCSRISGASPVKPRTLCEGSERAGCAACAHVIVPFFVFLSRAQEKGDHNMGTQIRLPGCAAPFYVSRNNKAWGPPRQK